MLRKSTLLRLLCLALFATLAAFGIFNVTAQPAHALYCADTFLGCSFSHIQEYSNQICCRYLCANGTYKTGVCEQIF